MRSYGTITKWLDAKERREIALKHGVTSSVQVSNIIAGRSKNFELLTALIERAEHNKKLFERSQQLESSTQ
jgi:hypothetical protein